MDNNRIVFLDYLRIFASFSVLLGHKFAVFLDQIHGNQNYYSGILTKFFHALYGGHHAGAR
jgi:hypothetical protein